MKPAIKLRRACPGARRIQAVPASEWAALLREHERLLDLLLHEQAAEAPGPAPEALQDARHEAPEAPAEPGPLPEPKLHQGEFLEAMEAWR